MLKEDQLIEEKWSKKNRKHYEELGYSYTGKGLSFFVPPEHLPSYSRRKVIAICSCCKEENEISYSQYLNNLSKNKEYICKKCTDKINNENELKKRQDRMYQIAVDYCNNNGYILLTFKDELTNMQCIVKFICLKHGLQEKKLTNMQQNKLCRLCANEERGKKSKEYWDSSLGDRSKYYYEKCKEICLEEGYKLLSKMEDLISYKSYVVYECKEHGIHQMRVGNFISGRRCPECRQYTARKHCNKTVDDYRLSKEEVAKRISDCGGVLLNPDDYINQTTKNLKIKCPVCGKIFVTSLRNFTQHGGQSCPSCYKKISVGERKIRDYLNKYCISYETEKWFPDCRDINPLPFDFYLPNYNACIEFDGEQHYKEKHFFNNVTTTYIQDHDSIKNKYCKDNNIYLIRIPYTKINDIEKILNDELTKIA